jgi:hypothetical protein
MKLKYNNRVDRTITNVTSIADSLTVNGSEV